MPVARGLRFFLLLSACAYAQNNLGFETGLVGSVPTGWYSGSQGGGGFQSVVTDQGCLPGGRCAVMSGPASPASGSYGMLNQNLAAGSYVSRRIRFRAAVRVSDAAQRAQLSMRGDRAGGGMTFYQNSGSISSVGWAYYQIYAEVPGDTAGMVFGFRLYGSGKAWVDDASFVVVAEDSPEAPRGLSETGLTNLTAFTRLLGYVRHFHPSDEAEWLDWHAFAVLGARYVEGAASIEELADRLRTLFNPVAPTARVFPTGSRPELPAELHPASRDGLRVVRWNHFGAGGLAPGSNIYHSERQSSPLEGGLVPDGFFDPGQPYEAELVPGLSVLVPLSLFADEQGTLPRASLPLYAAGSYLTYWIPDDRGTRLAGVALAWNAIQHFYPYLDVVDTDWAATLADALNSAATDTGALGYGRTLSHLVGEQKDGHGYGWQMRDAQQGYRVPLIWDWVEGQLVVTRIKDDQGQGVWPGDRVLTIDGKPVADEMAEEEQYVSGATPQWRTGRTLQNIAYCDRPDRQMVLEIEPYASRGSISTVQFACSTDFSWSEDRGEMIQELEPGILYVDLDRLTSADYQAALPRLVDARGIIFDLRGYPRTMDYVAHLTESPVSSVQWHVPVPVQPDRVQLAFRQSGWWVSPLQPYLSARRVFLTGGGAVSYAETVMGIVENYRLAEIVGGHTAGTNGSINYNDLPGGFLVSFTGMKVLKHDGSQHHGVGIHPTVPAVRTRRGIAEARDEVLLRGLEVVKWPVAGPSPAISAEGIVNSASFVGGAVAPGEMVTLFGSGLGPAGIALGTYDISGYLSSSVGDTKVFFDEIQAPLVHSVSGQVTAIVPSKVTSSTKVRVEYQGRRSNEVTVPVTGVAPGIFGSPGTTQAVVVNQDSSLNSELKPATRGEFITFFATGEGLTTPRGFDGKLPETGRWPAPDADLSVTFGGVPGEVLFKGEIYTGVLQLNVKVPAGAPSGNAVPLVVTVGGVPSPNGPTLALR